MPKSFTPRQLIRLLERHGFRRKRQRGSHIVYQHPSTRRRAIVPYHAKDLTKGTLHEILKQAGLIGSDL